jgi:hypothetical protein
MHHRAAELKSTTLEATLSRHDLSNPDLARHMRLEEEAREQYAQTKARLDGFERVLGSPSDDVQALTAQLREKEEALKGLRIKQEQDEKVRFPSTRRSYQKLPLNMLIV